MSSKKLDED